MIVAISIVASAITSVIVTKTLAVHYFKIVDSYVKNMCDLTNKSNEYTLATVHKLAQNFSTDGDRDIERFVEEFIQK